MKVKWLGILAVLLIAGGIIAYKARVTAQPQATTNPEPPRVLLVADLKEADSAGDICAQIIHLVREARDRGISVRELEPDSKSELLTRYHVLIIPTVLILDRDGTVTARYEGEGRDTLKAVRSGLLQLK